MTDMGTLRRFFCSSEVSIDFDEDFILVCEVEPGYKRTWYRVKAWLHL